MGRLKGGEILLDLSNYDLSTITGDGYQISTNILSSDISKPIGESAYRFNLSKELKIKYNYNGSLFVVPLCNVDDIDNAGYYAFEFIVGGVSYTITFGVTNKLVELEIFQRS